MNVVERREEKGRNGLAMLVAKRTKDFGKTITSTRKENRRTCVSARGKRAGPLQVAAEAAGVGLELKSNRDDVQVKIGAEAVERWKSSNEKFGGGDS